MFKKARNADIGKLRGEIVFASGKQGDYDIFKLSFETKGTVTQLTTGDCWNDSPNWSPDGKTIAFTSTRSGFAELWLMDADGGRQRQLTHTERFHLSPAWHPSGNKLVFCVNHSDNADIYTINSDGSNLTQITTFPGTDYSPRFSPDGGKIIYSSCHEGNDDIWLHVIESGKKERLTTHPARDFAPVYSPDGRFIAFVSGRSTDDDSDLDIYIMNCDGTNVTRITENRGTDRFVTWSPDGRYLLYTASEKDSCAERLKLVDLTEAKFLGLGYDRRAMENEIDAEVISIFSSGAEGTEGMVRSLFYKDEYFGTERSPSWKY
ncbi:MAG: DPP IV N-terminal domain-containing protein [Candidatus Wallbacteria bacterium]|nr:DPP IV N-terminal domain-containing protein [Candidatus Wallbacteria bacterium]